MSLAVTAAAVGGVAALGTAGAGIYGATQAGKGGEVSPMSFAATNPGAQFLGSLFGGFFGTENNAPSFEPFGPGYRSNESRFPSSIFGTNQREAIRDWLNPLPFSDLEQQAMDLFGTDVESQYRQTAGLFDDLILPGAAELVTTGFRTDIDPIRQMMLREFEQNTIPGLREQFLGQTGSFSSDFLGSTARAGGDMYTQLGALQTELDEAAAQRRATGLPLLSQLSLARQDLPMAVANAALDFGGRSRLSQEALRPGGRTLDVLGILTGLGAPGNMGFVGAGGFPSQTAGLLSGLGNAGSGFAAAGNLLSGLLRPSGGAMGGGAPIAGGGGTFGSGPIATAGGGGIWW